MKSRQLASPLVATVATKDGVNQCNRRHVQLLQVSIFCKQTVSSARIRTFQNSMRMRNKRQGHSLPK